MTSLVGFAWRVAVAVGIPFVVLVTTVSPLRGEMCSAIVSVPDGKGIEDVATLQTRTFAAFRSACRKPAPNRQSCMFNTAPSRPMTVKFILGSVRVPFKVSFDVKTGKDAVVALAENTALEYIFAQISIGGWGNSKSAVRACSEVNCTSGDDSLLAEHVEKDLLNETEYRPFWVEYKGGVVTVGKGDHQESFLEWNAGGYHGRIPSEVYVGISTQESVNGSWVFYDFCE